MAANSSQTGKNLHFLLIPLMSQSHIIPIIDFAKLLAKRGVTVSIVVTPSNAKRYGNSIIDVDHHATKSNLKIHLITVDFPSEKFGLPQGCESLDSLTSHDLFVEFFEASDMPIREQLEKIIPNLEPKPSCIICTNALPWTQEVATKFNIPRFTFQTISCFTAVCSQILEKTKVAEVALSDKDMFLVPDVPDKIQFTKAQLMESTIKHSDKLMSIFDRIKRSQNLACGILINTFEELEPWYVNKYKEIKKNVLCVGPVSLCNKEVEEKRNRGNIAAINGDNDQDCVAWLDSMKPRSVIYACFGTLCQISHSQLREIGLGLEASGSPFIWVIRGLNFSSQFDTWLEEDGFKERVKGRGLVVRGWAPQVAILSHPSVGGFLTHCGWNSTLEGVCSGMPMVTFPMFAEQFYNEKLIVDVLKIGTRVGVGVSMNSWQEEENGTLVKREQVKEAIDCLMGDERVEKRKRAHELAKMAMEAGEEEGSSYLNITSLIQDVMQMQDEEI